MLIIATHYARTHASGMIPGGGPAGRKRRRFGQFPGPRTSGLRSRTSPTWNRHLNQRGATMTTIIPDRWHIPPAVGASDVRAAGGDAERQVRIAALDKER